VRIIWSSRAWDEYQYWFEHDLGIARKINALVRDIRQDPFRGLGKPEPLKGNLQGWWSRRITEEHRLLYRVAGQGAERNIEIAQCRYHYVR
jgi:toxin YoeB